MTVGWRDREAMWTPIADKIVGPLLIFWYSGGVASLFYGRKTGDIPTRMYART